MSSLFNSRSSSFRLLLLLLLVAFYPFGRVEGFGRGAPGDVEKSRGVVCDELRPVHFEAPFQDPSTNPFSVRVAKLSDPGSLEVVLGVKDGSEDVLIMGFLVQARDKGNEIIGTFDTEATENITLTCKNTTVSQYKKQWKKQIKLVWLAPFDFEGEVQFHVLILENTTVFWKFEAPERPYVDTRSSVAGIKIRKSSSDEAASGEASSSSSSSSSANDQRCGRGSGCFACPGGSCLVRWTPGNTTIKFEVEMALNEDYVTPYVALALSLDKKMGDDSVTECSMTIDRQQLVRMSWNDGYNNHVLDEPDRSIVPGSKSVYLDDKFLRCSFERYLTAKSDQPSSSSSSSSSDVCYYPGDGDYYLLVAMGELEEDQSMGIMLTHHVEKYASQDKINFTAAAVQEASTSYDRYLVKAHGVIMTVAWLFLASFASLLPRYFKKKLPGVKVLKKPFWFALHQGLMLTVVILTVVSFILIFVEVGGYAWLPNPGSAHPPLGILVTVLVVFNPIMALFRCDAGTKNRWIFDLFHFFVGQSALVLAVIVIFLSVSIKKADLPYWLNWILTWHVCWHVFTELLLTAHDKHSQSVVPPARSGDILMVHEQNNEVDKPQPKTLLSSTRLPPTLLVVYSVVSLVTTLVIAVTISTA